MASSDLTSLPAGVAPVSGDRLLTGQLGNSRAITVDQARAFGDKRDATTAPKVTDDSASGFRVGSVFVDVTNDRSYRCLDASVGAAVWREESGPSKSVAETAAPTIDDDDSLGFSSGSVWVDVTNDRSYRCADASTGAAVWLLETVAPDVLVVRTVGDMPAPIANVITLPSNAVVVIEGTITLGTTDFVDVPAGTVLRGRASELDEIVGDTATQVVRFQSGGADVRDLKVTQNGIGNTLELNFAGIHVVDRCEITGGPIDAALGDGFLLLNSRMNGSGVLFGSAFGGGAFFDQCLFNTLLAADVGVDFAAGASADRFTMTSCRFDVVAAAFGLRVDDQNQVSDGAVLRCAFLGAGTPASGVDETSNNWTFQNNIGVGDSNDNAITRTAPGIGAAGTVALTVNVWSPVSDGGVNITYVLGATSEKFSLNDANTGEVVYDGALTRTYYVQGLVTIENNAAGQNVIEIGIDKNASGTPDPDSIHLIEIEPARFQQLLMPLFPLELASGDTVELLIRNVTNSEDVDVSISTLTVTS